MGCNRNLAAETNASSNNLYAYNTFVNAGGITTSPYNVLFYAGTATNGLFENNIVDQEDSLPIGTEGGTGITFSHNLWSKAPPSNMNGLGDVIGNPALSKAGSFVQGQLSGNYFKLLSSSYAIGKALAISNVIDDYFGNTRGSAPDIGGDQYSVSSVTSTPFPSSTNTTLPTSTNAPSPTSTLTATSTMTITPSLTFTPKFTSTSTFTPTITDTFTPTVTDTITPSNTPTATETPLPTDTPTLTPSPTDTFTPTSTNTPECKNVQFNDGTIIIVCKP